jgi:Na+-transporting NADH:ubiquinone oxidoreductase subunit B
MPNGQKQTLLMKQKIMRQVLLALVPCIAGAVYYFGWRSLAMVGWAALVGFGVEYLFEHRKNKPVTEAVFVTTTLLALVMPPSVPWHVLTIGTVFAVMMSKEVFGGFARNIFNPALAGRCFVYICFPIALTGVWAPAAQGPLGALTQWSTVSSVDAVSSATPMAYIKSGNLKIAKTSEEQVSESIPNQIGEEDTVVIRNSLLTERMLSGRISGTMGATSAVLISIGGIWLFIKKIASRDTILSVIISYAVLNEVLFWCGVPPVPGAGPAVLGGGFLLGAFFMATDPVSSPKTKEGRIIYGIVIGTCALVIRNFSIFNGGLMFAILIGNMFAPIIDYAVKSVKAPKKTGEAAA